MSRALRWTGPGRTPEKVEAREGPSVVLIATLDGRCSIVPSAGVLRPYGVRCAAL